MRSLPHSSCPEFRLALRGVEAPDGYLIDRELARGFREDRLHEHDRLQASRRPLVSAWRRIRQDRHSPPAHRQRLVQQRDGAARRRGIGHLAVRSVVADNKHIQGQDPAFLREANFHSSLKTGARATDVLFLFAANAHHDRSMGLLRKQSGDNQRDAGRSPTPEPATRVFADENNIAGLDLQPPRNVGDALRGALRGRVNIDLAVLPVRHRS